MIYPLLTAKIFLPFWQQIQEAINPIHVIVLLILVNYLIGFFLYAGHPVTHNFVDDWFNHARSFLCFIAGFALVKMPNLWKTFSVQRWYFLVAATITYAYCLFSFHGGSLGDSTFAKEISGLIWSANMWLSIFCMLAWALHAFTSNNPILNYLNGGVFCFYILHQTLIIVFAYFLVPLKLGPIIEPLLLVILVTTSCLLLFEIIRRLPIIPILFGITEKYRVKNALTKL